MELQGGLKGVMRLLEGDEFVRGILEPAGLALADVQEMSAHVKSLRSTVSRNPNVRTWLHQQPSLALPDQAATGSAQSCERWGFISENYMPDHICMPV